MPVAEEEVLPSRVADRVAGVCAVFITYHPGPEVIANLRAVRPQVRRMIVVDNESSAASRAFLSGAFAGDAAVELLFNAENRGIATALNQGIARAVAAGHDWIATFDQDSTAPDGYIAGLLAGGTDYPGTRRIAILAPLYRDRHLGMVFSPGGPLPAGSRDTVPVSVTATSGNLVAAAAWREVGGFREDLFIDCVDFEFCLRCRRAGWLVLEVRTVLLEHAAGRWQQRRWLWKNPRFNDYPAVRRYYQARNRLIVLVRYLGFDPRWVLRDAWGYGCDFLKLLLFCGERGPKLRATATGFWDALTGRRGPWRP
ncbi:MAG: glycosyl transferase family 2 [Lacunisphaera sp.]|nr:glycosyl transferase family 2 [Lacunisphaera sp.]